jgi:Ca-activated chloride channel family protein
MRFRDEDYGHASKINGTLFVSILLYSCFVFLTSGLGFAQTAGNDIQRSPKPEPSSSIRVHSDLVQIPVTVLDRDDQSVFGLEKEQFKLFEDRVEQVISHFAMEDAPITIGFVLDASASMRNKLPQSREAVVKFLNAASTGDEFFLVQFNDQVELATDMTTSTEEVKKQLMFIRPTGRTALLDAVHFSVRSMRKASNARRALIIVSDGGDNCSRYTTSEIKKLVREADVQIYALGIFDSMDRRSLAPEELAGPALLRGVAKQSGGHLFEIENINQLPDVAAKIGEALRTQYVLGYAPKAAPRDGKYHRVEVKLAQAKGSRKLQASWRRGYYAPVE